MRRSSAAISLCLALGLCARFGFSHSPPAAAYDIFYLSVGSSNYVTNGRAGRFSNIEGANKSARQVASILDKAGAIAGITLTSRPNMLVTRSDTFNALRAILRRAKESTARNRLLVFYFCGHGISEGIGWNEFLIPGNYDLAPSKATIDTLTETAIYAGEISDEAEKQQIGCLLLIDACYSGNESVVSESSIVSKTLADNLTDSFKVLRYMNEFRGPTMAVFSTKPGSESQTVQDPFDSESTLSVGRVARRVMLSFKNRFDNKRPLTIGQFLRLMGDVDFDEPSRTVLTLSKPDNPDMELIKFPTAERSVGEMRVGSGTAGSRTARGAASKGPARGGSVPSRLSYKVLPETIVEVTGEPGDYVSGGQTFELRSPRFRFAPSEERLGEFKLSITSTDSDWDMTLVAPKGNTLQRGEYIGAQRARLQDAANPGFEFSGDARACNEVEARFVIRDIGRDSNGRIVRLDAEFFQRCTGSTKSLRGRVHFRAQG